MVISFLFLFIPRIVYSLVRNISDPVAPIEIDVDSGMLVIKGSIDRERVDFYHLTVEANVGTAARSTADVYVYVQDVNDNTPQFATKTTRDLQSYTIAMQSRYSHKYQFN